MVEVSFAGIDLFGQLLCLGQAQRRPSPGIRGKVLDLDRLLGLGLLRQPFAEFAFDSDYMAVRQF